MKHSALFHIRWCIMMLIPIIIIGCRSQTPPVSFYTLSPIPRVEKKTTAPFKSVSLGIGPVTFPKYLERPQIVTRTGPHRLSISEFHRWGGYLKQDFVNVLTENLITLLPPRHMVKFPWEGHVNPPLRLELDIHAFDGNPGDFVLLNVTWTLRDPNNKKQLYVRKSVIREPVGGQDYEAFVSACSNALATLSREIASTINNMNQSPSGSFH